MEFENWGSEIFEILKFGIWEFENKEKFGNRGIFDLINQEIGKSENLGF